MSKKYLYIFLCICLLWTLYHGSFLHLNDMLKVADSFAYLQMSYFFKELSVEGFGNGWFGFIYSLPIAVLDIFIGNDFLSAKIINLILINISAVLLWKLSKKFLPEMYALGVIALWFASPTFLHFNIHVLSENIYIPLFLGTLLCALALQEHAEKFPYIKHSLPYSIGLWALLALLYLTRAEAFIYAASIGIFALGVLLAKKMTFKQFLWLGSSFVFTFFLCIFPYIAYMHSFTGEWGLTNKGASNLRQAELRGQDKMDDAGFEQAVAELTADKHHLIAGFAGGMPYDTPQIEGSLKEFIRKDPQGFLKRVAYNQYKLYTKNLPQIFIGKSPELFASEDARFANPFFLLYLFLPFGILIFWMWKLFRQQKVFFFLSLSFFLIASFFFTLFFTLDRYFLIFLPLMLLAYMYGLSHIFPKKKYLQACLYLQLLSLFALSTFVYYQTESPKDNFYLLKAQAGEVLAQMHSWDLSHIKIMERFPIVTYYSGSKIRYITPYTDTPQDIYEYARYNNIDYLVVDTMDFQTYRPELRSLLETPPPGFETLFSLSSGDQKVILYKRVN